MFFSPDALRMRQVSAGVNEMATIVKGSDWMEKEVFMATLTKVL